MQLLFTSVTIAVVNLSLSGDNAILIAIVTRSLPRELRRRSVMIAAGCDVVARTATTFFAAELLRMPLLKFAGGLLVLFMSLRLFRAAEPAIPRLRQLESCWRIVGFLVTADLLMSTDNMVAIAGIAQDRIPLLFTGHIMSIPPVFYGSQIVCSAMRRFSSLMYVAGTVLGSSAEK